MNRQTDPGCVPWRSHRSPAGRQRASALRSRRPAGSAMPLSPSSIDTLKTAIANPEKQIALKGQQVVFRSVAELICARDALIQQIEKKQAAVLPSRSAYGYQRGRGC